FPYTTLFRSLYSLTVYFNSCLCLLIRSLAISKYPLSNSNPMKLRLLFRHAIAVVPLPIQLSNTVSPSVVYVLIRYSNNSVDFCVGCTAPFGLGNAIMD